MGTGIRIVGTALSRWAERFDKMLVANLVAALLGLPLYIPGAYAAFATHDIALGAAITALLVGILPNPASAGLQLMTREMAAGELLLMPGPFEGLRLYWKDALRVWLVSLPVTVIIIANVLFYATLRVPFAAVAELVALYVLLAWLGAHVYVYPLILEQEDKRLRTLYRNAFVMAMSRPLITLQVLVVWVIVLMAGSASGLLVAVGLSIAAALQQQAAATILPSFHREGANREQDAESA